MLEQAPLTSNKEAICQMASSWLRALSSTIPVDRQIVEQQIKGAYNLAGLSAPEQIYWTSSPFEGVLTVSIIRALADEHNLSLLTSNNNVMKKIFRKAKKVTRRSGAIKELNPSLALSAASIIHQELLKNQTARSSHTISVMHSVAGSLHSEVAAACNCMTCDLLHFPVSQRKAKRRAKAALDGVLPGLGIVHEAYWRPMRTTLHREIFASAKGLPAGTKSTSSKDPTDPHTLKRIKEVVSLLPNQVQASILKDQLKKGLSADTYSYLYSTLRGYLSIEYYSTGLVNEDTLRLGYLGALAPLITDSLSPQELSGLEIFTNSSLRLWTYKNFTVVTQNPKVVKLDPQGRLHCEHGPALEFTDGFKVYSWHGTRVPHDLIAGHWAVDRILNERNLEIRRCAIEKMGWDEFVSKAHLSRVGGATDDPANPGQMLELFHVPRDLMRGVHLLLCTNATLESDGTRRRFGITVPAAITDPVAAAAWSFGVPVETYRKLERSC